VKTVKIWRVVGSVPLQPLRRKRRSVLSGVVIKCDKGRRPLRYRRCVVMPWWRFLSACWQPSRSMMVFLVAACRLRGLLAAAHYILYFVAAQCPVCALRYTVTARESQLVCWFYFQHRTQVVISIYWNRFGRKVCTLSREVSLCIHLKRWLLMAWLMLSLFTSNVLGQRKYLIVFLSFLTLSFKIWDKNTFNQRACWVNKKGVIVINVL
jgi:hypothetical protein